MLSIYIVGLLIVLTSLLVLVIGTVQTSINNKRLQKFVDKRNKGEFFIWGILCQIYWKEHTKKLPI